MGPRSVKRGQLLSLVLGLILTANTSSYANNSLLTDVRERLSAAMALVCSSGILVPLAPRELARQLDYPNIKKPVTQPTTHLLNWHTVLSDPQWGELVFIGKKIGSQFKRLEIRASVWAHKQAKPVMMVRLNNTCTVTLARAIEYDAAGIAKSIIHLNNNLIFTGTREPLDPPVPIGRDRGGVLVAHIDSGINYLLPEFRDRLARDKDGNIRGWDFWDNDPRPFDINIVSSPFFPLHHGTAVASILLREAPVSKLVPYRYPRPNMSRMAEVIRASATAGVRIALMPMGSSQKSDWIAFQTAARQHTEILFIVSAGNNGRNIDITPLFPASLTLDNLLVVTSSDDFGRLAFGSNWGAESVDLMVPGEQIKIIDHRGAKGRASGASFAAPRVAALAARLLAQNPSRTTAELKAAILQLATKPRVRGQNPVKAGWIPNPTDHNG